MGVVDKRAREGAMAVGVVRVRCAHHPQKKATKHHRDSRPKKVRKTFKENMEYMCVCAFVGEIEEEKGKGHGLNE